MLYNNLCSLIFAKQNNYTFVTFKKPVGEFSLIMMRHDSLITLAISHS